MNKNILLFVLFVLYINAEILPFDNKAVQKIFQNKSPALFLFTNDNDKSQAAKQAFKTLDQTKPEGYVLTTSDKNDGHGLFDRLSEYLGVNTANVPVVLFMGQNAQKYFFDKQQITSDNLVDFVNRVKAGQIQQFLKSAEVPEQNNAPVKIIVGKTFQQLVMNSDQQILVKFYAPWCGHCKTIAPHFDQAAERLANNPNILIAKVDSTENQVANVDIQGFPTLKFFKKDKTQAPIDFNGERTADGIIQWLKDHTEYQWVEEAAAVKSEEL